MKDLLNFMPGPPEAINTKDLLLVAVEAVSHTPFTGEGLVLIGFPQKSPAHLRVRLPDDIRRKKEVVQDGPGKKVKGVEAGNLDYLVAALGNFGQCLLHGVTQALPNSSVESPPGEGQFPDDLIEIGIPLVDSLPFRKAGSLAILWIARGRFESFANHLQVIVHQFFRQVDHGGGPA